MNSRRFKVYVDRTDVEDIYDTLTGMGALFVAGKSEEPRLRILDKEEIVNQVVVLVVPPTRKEELLPRSAPNSRWHVLNSVVDPVVEFVPSYPKDAGLTPGRFYFVEEYVVGGTFVAKPDDVKEFAGKVFSWARRWSKRADGKACGPSAAAAVRQGRIRLSP